MSKFVIGTVLMKNTVSFHECPQNQQIPCEHVEIRGEEWLVPIKKGGILVGYQNRIYRGNTPPTPDSIKTVRVWDKTGNNHYWIVIANTDTAEKFADTCNLCCDQSPDMTVDPATLPKPILEEDGCAEVAPGATSYTYIANSPLNPYGQNITLDITYNGGTVPTPAPPAAGFATIAAAITWANTNWGAALGTLSPVGTTGIKLVSSTVESINFAINLLPADFCLTPPATAFTATKLVVQNDDNTTEDEISISPLNVVDSNAAGVQAALQAYLPGTLTVVGTKVQYAGNQKPLRLESADGLTTAAFAAGVCAP